MSTHFVSSQLRNTKSEFIYIHNTEYTAPGGVDDGAVTQTHIVLVADRIFTQLTAGDTLIIGGSCMEAAAHIVVACIRLWSTKSSFVLCVDKQAIFHMNN